LGTPALTTRGLKEAEMEQVAKWIDRAITANSNDTKLADIKKEILAFAEDYPLPK
jgi:glycine hydroxymethyltransferase